MSTIFLEMAKVIDEELMAGRITVVTAKARLQINADIALDIECLNAEGKFSYTSADAKRDRRQLDAFICCGQIRGVN